MREPRLWDRLRSDRDAVALPDLHLEAHVLRRSPASRRLLNRNGNEIATVIIGRRRQRSSLLVRLIKSYRIHWAVFTMALNAAAIATVVFVFPDVSNLWVSIFVLVSGFSASVTSLGDLLVSAEESDHEQIEQGRRPS